MLEVVTPDDVEKAARRIAGYVRETPILDLGDVVLKLELLQHTGSFKPRGAFNRILARGSPSAVLAASGGNHGLAVAHAARALGLRAEIFVPEVVSAVKLARLEELGAHVEVVPGFYADALAASERRAEATGALVVHAYDQAEVVAGQGTLGRELERQAPDAGTVLVAVGGGGLIGGIATWFGGRRRIVGVEPAGAPTLHAALAAGAPVDIEVSGIAADSLGARRIGNLGFAAARAHVDVVVLVEDDDIRTAQRWLWDEVRIAAEPGGAAALAALRSGAYSPAGDERVAVLVCGGNVDLASLGT